MWVRSQDGELISNGTITYEIDKDKKNFHIFMSSYDTSSDYGRSYVALATYSSKSKDLAVMDLLEEFLVKLNCSLRVNAVSIGAVGHIATQRNDIFHFPKDEEVKVIKCLL